MSNFTVYKPTPAIRHHKSGPPIVKIERTPGGTVLRLSAVIRHTLDVKEQDRYPHQAAFIKVLVDKDAHRIAIVNTTKDAPEAIEVRGLGASAYAAAGALIETYGIPEGRYEAVRESLHETDLDDSWILDWTKDLGPGKNTNKKR